MLDNRLMKEIDYSRLSPMMKQWYDIKEQNQDCLIFFRLGDFYELFYDDALLASRVLEITLTQRDCGQEKKAPMCGVPFHAVSQYLNRLLLNNYKVAICEQMQDPKTTKGLVERKLTQYITPGTLTDITSITEHSNNFLMAVYSDSTGYSLAYTDITTGFIRATFIAKTEGFAEFLEEIIKINPSEVLMINSHIESGLLNKLVENNLFLTSVSLDEVELFTHYQLSTDLFVSDEDNKYNLASYQNKALRYSLAILYSYILKTQQEIPISLRNSTIYQLKKYMFLPSTAQKSLEIFQSVKTLQKKDSLLDLLDQCKTAMGSRMIKRMLGHILLDKQKIEQRQACVKIFLENYSLRKDLQKDLQNISDLERLSQKLQNQSINPRQLLQLSKTIKNSVQILHYLNNWQEANAIQIPLKRSFKEDLKLLEDKADYLQRALLEDPPIQIKDGNIFQNNFHPLIEEYREYASSGKQKILNLEQKTKQEYQIKNLKIGYNRIFGYYFEVLKSSLGQVPDSFIRKQTLANAERYITDELKDIEDKILSSQGKLLNLEYNLFMELREDLANLAMDFLALANDLAELDVYISLADLADKYNYVQPQITSEPILVIEQGRHPVIEAKDLTSFVPNDLFMDGQKERLLLITGPNMGGKSTYMRQNAIITIMAQIGSFVPAKHAVIGICDSIFTRIGASDDLASGKSTFMVEMSEVSYILKHMTKQSLILLDEVGRGTSTTDGLSLASALTEYLSKQSIPLRILFATHYHELVHLSKHLNNIVNYHVAVSQQEKELVFLHQIKPGSCDDSFGIEVALLSGIPKTIIAKAKLYLQNLNNDGFNEQNYQQLSLISDVNRLHNQQEIAEEEFLLHEKITKYEDFLTYIKSVNLDECTPIQALQILSDYQDKVKHLLDK